MQTGDARSQNARTVLVGLPHPPTPVSLIFRGMQKIGRLVASSGTVSEVFKLLSVTCVAPLESAGPANPIHANMMQAQLIASIVAVVIQRVIRLSLVRGSRLKPGRSTPGIRNVDVIPDS